MSFTAISHTPFLSGCGKQLPLPASTADTCQPREEAPFDDADSALDHIQDSVPEDAILALGYTHREVAAHRSALKIIAEEVVPELKNKGYTDAVLEIFPKGDTNSLIEQEIAEFNRSGTIGKEMNRFFNDINRGNFKLLLKIIHDKGIKIHSGGLDYENIFETMWYPNFTSYPQRMEQAKEEIAKNTGERIKSLANDKKQKRKIFSLNGATHNDLYPHQRNAAASFGKSLWNTFKDRIVEVDLVIPELSARYDSYEDLPLSKKCFWENFIPKSGVNLVSERGKNSYLLFWPNP